jgi:hypothetical protein
MVDVQGFAECPVNMDCKMVVLEEIPGTDYVLLVGRKIGVTLDKEIAESLNPDTNPLHDRLVYANDFYSRFMYSVMDSDMKRKWGFHDKKGISVRELPSWGSRYTGGWWGPGPALSYWLIELCQSGLLTKIDYNKITAAVGLFNNGRFVSYLAEFFTEDIKKELREKLTILFHMMAWAHRDYEKWEKIHLFLETFPDEIRRHHDGPVYFEKWYDQKI